jgi:glyoxylase-like metal-dependent hydrolase (beta-lactamase superfamily II)
MNKIHIIDLAFLQEEQTVAAFLIESSEGPILVETGPESTWPQLEAGIKGLGCLPKDIQHVLLTHIHFDHAGAAWRLAEQGATIYVHPVGLPHLASPDRLWDSAFRIYGEDMDRLWGEMKPIPASQLKECLHGEVLQFGDVEMTSLHTPGHATHHIAWQLGNKIFTGDVAGVQINQGPVVPPCPPPDIHLENWKSSIELLKAHNPQRLYLTHFGVVDHPKEHLEQLEVMLDNWAQWMKNYHGKPIDQKEVTERFMAYTQQQLESRGLSQEDIQRYEYANPSWMSVAGLLRYWRLKSQGRM